MNVEQATIKELRQQVRDLTRENKKLRNRLGLWPRRALDHALNARKSEREAIAREHRRRSWES